MKANLKVILSSVGLAAVLVSPTMAKQTRPHNATALITVPSDVRGSVTPIGSNEGGPYTPSAPTQPYGGPRNFQGGGGNY